MLTVIKLVCLLYKINGDSMLWVLKEKINEQRKCRDGDVRRKDELGQRIAYACGNFGAGCLYNAMSTYFVTYVTSCLFVSYSKALAAQMIAVITGLIVVIRIAEIFIDPLLGNLVDNTTTKWGRFRPWQFIGGLVSSVLIVLIFSGMFRTGQREHHAVHRAVHHHVHRA